MSNASASRVLILGVGGMLGSAVFRLFSEDNRYLSFGTLRSTDKLRHFSEKGRANIISNIDVSNDVDLVTVFARAKPDFVINCVGVIKQLDASRDHLTALSLNALFPHRLSQYCKLTKSRLIHISTDCVFSGTRGNYVESDFADADDLYGRSKYLGEVDYPLAVTLRTSIIGHELDSARSLVDWFLSQNGTVKGYRNAIFSGLPTVEIARVIKDYVIPNEHLRGVYHLSAAPISKHDLLSMVAEIYGAGTKIVPDDAVVIDRSLNSNRFTEATGFKASPWRDLITAMHQNYLRYRPNTLPNSA